MMHVAEIKANMEEALHFAISSTSKLHKQQFDCFDGLLNGFRKNLIFKITTLVEDQMIVADQMINIEWASFYCSWKTHGPLMSLSLFGVYCPLVDGT